MREKKPYFVVTYFTTAEAMATERLCKARGIEGRLISAPRSVTADCGIAWRSLPESKEIIKSALAEANIEVQGFYDLEL
ncbi:MAG: DUF3343 domain-containing protein [Saccharofermentans sp.]|nr:DUF3343 domain-containing protein [Saccharofermentans sp.]